MGTLSQAHLVPPVFSVGLLLQVFLDLKKTGQKD
jgi:hypothetical protein